MDAHKVQLVVERCRAALDDARAALVASERENHHLKLELAATRAALDERRLVASSGEGGGAGVFADAGVREAIVRALARAGGGTDALTNEEEEDDGGGRSGRRADAVRARDRAAIASATARPSIASVIDDIGPVPLSPSPLKK